MPAPPPQPDGGVWRQVGRAALTAAGLPGADRAAGGVYHAAVAVPEFLGRLADGRLWLRVAEVAIGAVLIVVGVAGMVGRSAARAARAVLL